MIQPFISTAARVLSLALLCAASPTLTCGQGTIVHVTPSTLISYGPVGDGTQRNLDLNGDGIIDYVLSFDVSGADFIPLGGNSIIADGGDFVSAIIFGQSITVSPSSLDPTYHWLGSSAILGGQAVFDGQYFYSGNFSGKDAFVGLKFQYSGMTHFGWIEIVNDPNVAAGQILGWAYETIPDTAIAAGQVPEPSAFALLLISGVAFGALWHRPHFRKLRW